MAAPTFADSILDRILVNNGVFPADYNPDTDGPIPTDYAINGTQFALTFLETHEGRFDDHVAGGPVVALETFWNVQPGGEGETEINWLITQYNASVDKDTRVMSVARLFSMPEPDVSIGLTYRTAKSNGYCDKQNLKDWVNAIP